MEVRGLTVKLARAQRLGDVDSAEPDEVLPARLLGIARDLERAVLSARVARDVHAEPAPSPSGAHTTTGRRAAHSASQSGCCPPLGSISVRCRAPSPSTSCANGSLHVWRECGWVRQMAGRALLGEGVLVGQVARLEHDDDERAEGARRHRGLNGEDNWARRWAMWGTARASGSAHDGMQLEVAVHELLVLLPHSTHIAYSLPHSRRGQCCICYSWSLLFS
jgi:hypothetical protein